MPKPPKRETIVREQDPAHPAKNLWAIVRRKGQVVRLRIEVPCVVEVHIDDVRGEQVCMVLAVDKGKAFGKERTFNKGE